MYKVFVNQDVIILTSEIPFGKKINLYDLKKKSLDEIISLVKKHHKIFLFHKNSEKLVSTFQKKIKVVKAGGGIVKNINDETLFIYRRNKWDLPKGKMDKGETIDQTALREVKEETGIKNLSIIDFKMNHYETVFILNPVLSEEQIKETVKKYEEILVSKGAKMISKENWGLKKLAYAIQHKKSGFYHLFEYTVVGEAINELEIEFRRDERVMRYLTVALDKHAIAWAEKRRNRNKKTA